MDGIVLAADSLKSDSGILVATRTAKKVFLLTPKTVICSVNSSGQGSTHFQQLYDELRETIQEHESRFGSSLSTTALCKVARQLVATRYPEAHIVLAGYDDEAPVSCTGSKLGTEGRVQYKLTEILQGGARMDQPVVAAGSGASVIASLLDEALNGAGVQSISKKVSAERKVTKQQLGVADHTFTTQEVKSSTDASFDPFCASSEDSNVMESVNLSVSEVAARLRQCLRQASRLDPHTGGDAFTVWVLRRDADTSNISINSSGSTGVGVETAKDSHTGAGWGGVVAGAGAVKVAGSV
jgi:20S proteasome alpha/beta subunit